MALFQCGSVASLAGGSLSFFVYIFFAAGVFIRDGPLENLWGVKYKKKYSRKGKLNENKFMHAN